MTVGDRIRARRKELGYSQLELSKKMGYSEKSAVSKAENCGDNITTTKIHKFAKALDCSFSYLMGWDEAQIESMLSNPEEKAKRLKYYDKHIKLMDKLDKLSKDDLIDVERYIDFIISRKEEN